MDSPLQPPPPLNERLQKHLKSLTPYAPAVAFLAGFAWDVWTLGRRIKPTDLLQLGAMLLASAGIILWLARRAENTLPAPWEKKTLYDQLYWLRWQAPYLLLQFLFGGIFSALFILYFKSTGHLGTAITALILAGLLIANEFMGRRYGQFFSLTWTLFGFNCILLMNFALPHWIGSVNTRWFYLSTVAGIALTHLIYHFAPGRPGRIVFVWLIGLGLMGALKLDMIAPVPLVKRDIMVGHPVTTRQAYALAVEPPSFWQFWRPYDSTVHIAPGEKLFAVTSVFAPQGISAPLEHRWEMKNPQGQWQTISRARFQAQGGRELGFRGYSWTLSPKAGEWRLVLATQSGQTIAQEYFSVVNEAFDPGLLQTRTF